MSVIVTSFSLSLDSLVAIGGVTPRKLRKEGVKMDMGTRWDTLTRVQP